MTLRRVEFRARDSVETTYSSPLYIATSRAGSGKSVRRTWKTAPDEASIRRNVAHVSAAERRRLKNAIVALNTRFYGDGVSEWFKQDQIHQVTHVHEGLAFLPWHREMINRFEALLRRVDPAVSLHYWDWTTDPRASSDGKGGTVDLFTEDFMGSPTFRMGAPFETFDNAGEFAGSRNDGSASSAWTRPPLEVTRDVNGGVNGNRPGAPPVFPDRTILESTAHLVDRERVQYSVFSVNLEGRNTGSAHDNAHNYIGGTLGATHSSFEDPFVFLLHSNVDRLWAMWQTEAGQEWRLDPGGVYGDDADDPLLTEFLQPWSGRVRDPFDPIRPWTEPENELVFKNSLHPSIVVPRVYDTTLDR